MPMIERLYLKPIEPDFTPENVDITVYKKFTQSIQ